MFLVINNDDLALTYGVTKGITECYQAGITTSSSILANGTSFDFTVNNIQTGKLKGIGLGIHLNLTDGPTFSNKLADHLGNYRFNFISLLREISVNKEVLKFISDDFEKQMQKVLSSNLSLDHIDSDKHVHMIPEVFNQVCLLAVKYKIPYIRITREPLYFSNNLLYPFKTLNVVKNLLLNSFSKRNVTTAKKYHLKFTDAVYGVLYSNYMDINNIRSVVSDAKKRKFKSIEILSHPGYIKDTRDKIFISPFMEKYSQEINRETEMRTLLNPKLKTFIKENNIKQVKFSDV